MSAAAEWFLFCRRVSCTERYSLSGISAVMLCLCATAMSCAVTCSFSWTLPDRLRLVSIQVLSVDRHEPLLLSEDECLFFGRSDTFSLRSLLETELSTERGVFCLSTLDEFLRPADDSLSRFQRLGRTVALAFCDPPLQPDYDTIPSLKSLNPLLYCVHFSPVRLGDLLCLPLLAGSVSRS